MSCRHAQGLPRRHLELAGQTLWAEAQRRERFPAQLADAPEASASGTQRFSVRAVLRRSAIPLLATCAASTQLQPPLRELASRCVHALHVDAAALLDTGALLHTVAALVSDAPPQQL